MEEARETRVRIRDIAEELGLSTATVSNVIHGKTNKVSDETIRRVQELLEKRQYIPSMAGILLAQNDSGIIGVVINRHEKYGTHVLEDPFLASSLSYLSSEIESSGKFMMIKISADMDEILRFASMWNMEGLILIGFCRQDYVWLRQSMRIPFVAYDAVPDSLERIGIVNIDNFSGGFQMGRFFQKLGHRQVLCIADNHISIDYERYCGFCEGLSKKADFWEIPMQSEARYRFYLEKLENIRDYTAVFAVSDFYAIDLMRFLLEHGIRIPQDISVGGFDDTPVCRQVYPQLTTIRQDGELRAKTALEQLMRLKSGKEYGLKVVLPVTLIERGSTGKLDIQAKRR